MKVDRALRIVKVLMNWLNRIHESELSLEDSQGQPVALLDNTIQDVNRAALLVTTTQDVIFRNIGWEQRPKMSTLQDIAWHHNLRCHPSRHCSRTMIWDINSSRHCLAPQPMMSSFVTLLGSNDLICQFFKTLLGTTTQEVILRDIALEQWPDVTLEP